MAGKMYYLTTLAAWQRHAHRFNASHWVALENLSTPPLTTSAHNVSSEAGKSPQELAGAPASPLPLSEAPAARNLASPPREGWVRSAENSSSAPGATQIACAANAPRDLSRAADELVSPEESHSGAATPILVLVEGDEGAHLALESDADFHQLPHPLAQQPIPDAAHCAIAASGIALPEAATTFEAAESVARVHPLLRHRVF